MVLADDLLERRGPQPVRKRRIRSRRIRSGLRLLIGKKVGHRACSNRLGARWHPRGLRVRPEAGDNNGGKTMKAWVLVAAGAAITGCSEPQADPEAAKRELAAANAAYDRALIDGDAATLQRIYTPDFQIIDDDANISGKQDQIRFMTQEVDLLHARSDDVRTTMLGPDSALMTGRFSGRYRYQGKDRDFIERYSAVWVRSDGAWKMKHEHSSIQPKAEAGS
jgi:ketosteroid isomerase-like protein